MAVRIMIMAGGTGGHVFPALAVAKWLIQEGHEVSWLGTKKGIEARLVPETGISIDWLSVSGLRGKGLKSTLLAPFMLLKACYQAYDIIRQRKPDVVLGLGGFASGPGGLMSYLLGKPLVIHEQNRVPGTTNRLLKCVAARVLEAFPDSFSAKSKAVFTGNPLRAELMDIQGMSVNKGRKILIIGGSLGASILNEVVPQALNILKKDVTVDVIHQAGELTLDKAKSNYIDNQVQAEVTDFIDDMKEVYQWADLVICRAGAMTISELAIMGLPAILVPLPHAIDDHQTKNAAYLSAAGAAVMMPQAEFTKENLAERLKALLLSPEKLKLMGDKAYQLSTPKATETVAKICLEAAL